MINLRNSPFLWLALVLLAANLTGHWIPEGASSPPLKEGIVIMMVVSFGISLRAYQPGQYWISTTGISLLVLCAGWLNTTSYANHQYRGNLHTTAVQVAGVIEVKQVLKIKSGSVSLQGRIHQLVTLNKVFDIDSVDQIMLVRIKEPDQFSYLPGDVLEIQGWLSAIPGPSNPHAFDARNYYSTLAIRHQINCQDKDVQSIHPPRKTMRRLTAKWQSQLSALVRSHTSPEVAQVTNALVWGDRSDMDVEILDAFADSGAMHVLSVSGMHVAMIYSLLYLILGAPGNGNLLRRMTRFGLYAVAILLYVGLTGACPAVVRAGLMILLFLFGKAMGWNTQVWNLLGFAAFMMLWLNPWIYRNIGFQLSFLAMAGILMYAKPIIRSLSFKSVLMQRIWDITALSLAAQIFILPVLLSVFHQFPLTFIMSSMVAMPAGYIVIVGALINLLLAPLDIPLLWHLLDLSCSYFINCMKWMAGLNPLMHYSLPSWSSLLLMGMTVSFSGALLYRWTFGKKIAFVIGITLWITLILHRQQQWNRNEWVVYHGYRGIAVDITWHGTLYSIYDPQLSSVQLEYMSRGYRCHRDIIHTVPITLDAEYHDKNVAFKNRVLTIGDLSVLLYADEIENINSGVELDFVLVSDFISLEKLESFLAERQVVQLMVSASCPKWKRMVVHKIANERNLPLYDIYENGYFRQAL
jgi:competence protein ComEC